jgi:sigma-E factor negative regulatory protein RseA
MSDSKKHLSESVSALVDGEVSELELHRILKQLQLEESIDSAETNDQSIANKWSRYNLISQAMANTPMSGKDISQSVSSAIAKEQTYNNHFLPGIFQATSMGRLAIAASVAFMAVMGVQQLNNVNPLQNEGLQAAATSNDSNQLQRPANQFPSGFQPMIEARTVNAGGVVKTSQHSSKVIKLYFPSDKSKVNKSDLTKKELNDKNTDKDALPVDFDTQSIAK